MDEIPLLAIAPSDSPMENYGIESRIRSGDYH